MWPIVVLIVLPFVPAILLLACAAIALRLARLEDGTAISAIVDDAEAVEEHSWSCLRARCNPPEPSAQTKAECDCPSLNGGKCTYPNCSAADGGGKQS